LIGGHIDESEFTQRIQELLNDKIDYLSNMRIGPPTKSAKLKSFIDMAGIEEATVVTYRDSFVKTMWDHGCHHKDLMMVSGTIVR